MNAPYATPASTSTSTSTSTPTPPKSYLGFRLAVGAVGLVILAMLGLLGSAAMKQSATLNALEARDNLRGEAESAPTGE